jgi:RimJ/RimL family protein N-acetyltransferase
MNERASVMLRELHMDDRQAILFGMNQPDLRKLIGANLPFTEADANYILRDGISDKQIWMGISDETTKVLLGLVALVRINNALRSGELSLTIFDSEKRSKGIGTFTLCNFLEYLFFCRNLNRVTAYVCDYNKKAIRFYEKFKFQVEGRIRQGCYWEGKYSDMITMGLLCTEYIPFVE